MSRLTVRLPDTLHQQLETLAKRESVSLNQYIVYALAQQTALAYTAQAVPEDDVAQQTKHFTALLQRLGRASSDEVTEALAARDTVEPEAELKSEAVKRLRTRIKDAGKTR